MAIRLVGTIGTTTLLALIGVLAKCELLLELATELAVHRDQLLARTDQRLTGRDAAVRLDTDKELRHIRMGDWI